MASEVSEEEVFGARRGIEGKQRDLAPALHAGERHVLLHLVDQPLPVLQSALDVGEGMLGIGEVPRVVVPGIDELVWNLPSALCGSKNQIRRSRPSPTTRAKGRSASWMPTAVKTAARQVLLVAVEERWETAFMGSLIADLGLWISD
jgi:hypothetical protein